MSSPLVIVGIGGSGTRVYTRLAEATGRHMGSIQNDSSDRYALFHLANHWCEPVHRAWQDGRPLPDAIKFEAELAASVKWHRRGATASAWGWKQPRSIHLLPALDAAYAGDLLVLHAMRDGRDVAFGKDIHLRQTAPFTVPAALREESSPIQLAHIWTTVNDLAADFGEQVLRERYLRISLEDLCREPERLTGEILDFIGGDASPGQLEGIVQTPDTIGRWRDADPQLASQVMAITGDGLQRFGYC